MRSSGVCIPRFMSVPKGGGLNSLFPSARHIDGQDYFWAVSEILDSARDVIFILVRAPLTWSDCQLRRGTCRIGGSRQSCTSGTRFSGYRQCKRAKLIAAHQPTPGAERRMAPRQAVATQGSARRQDLRRRLQRSDPDDDHGFQAYQGKAARTLDVDQKHDPS